MFITEAFTLWFQVLIFLAYTNNILRHTEWLNDTCKTNFFPDLVRMGTLLDSYGK